MRIGEDFDCNMKTTVWVINIQGDQWKFHSTNLGIRASRFLLHSQCKCCFHLCGGSHQLVPAQLQSLTVGKSLSLLLHVLFEAYRATLAQTISNNWNYFSISNLSHPNTPYIFVCCNFLSWSPFWITKKAQWISIECRIC